MDIMDVKTPAATAADPTAARPGQIAANHIKQELLSI